MKTSLRIGNILRVYIGRPWFQTGAGELLGVVVAAPPPGAPLPSTLAPFVSGYGLDPVFEAGRLKTAAATDFTLAVHQGKALLLEEQTGTVPWVDVAGHEVAWDKDRQLWFSDIEISTISATTYFPFVKLALVRYQPSSLKGLELSRVVQADFIQVTPDRVVTMSFPTPTTVKVAVAGPGYLATTDPLPPIPSGLMSKKRRCRPPTATWCGRRCLRAWPGPSSTSRPSPSPSRSGRAP